MVVRRPMYTLERDVHDDPAFVEVASRLITGAVCAEDVDRFVIVKIDNWFGSRWLGFRYKVLGAAGVREWNSAAPELVPPFIPGRVVSQQAFPLLEDAERTSRVHSFRHSAANRHNKLSNLVSGTALFWWSGLSASNARGSV